MKKKFVWKWKARPKIDTEDKEGKFYREVIEPVVNSFRYRDYLILHCIPYSLTKTEELRICCPKCCEANFKLYINDRLKKFNCFVCGFNSGRYDVVDLIGLLEGLTRTQVVTRLG